MQYQFCGTLHKEGNRTFIAIPFNVWEKTGLKGNIPCRVRIQDQCMECKLMPFSEVKNINSVNVDDEYIYVSGSPVDGDDHTLFVYDHSGVLQMTLTGEPGGSFGLGSITFAAKTPNGFLAMDGNMRTVVLWSEDGTWLGEVEDSDLFNTYYPWFATGDVMDDGSILVVMTEDRDDGSAMEAIAFKITVS